MTKIHNKSFGTEMMKFDRKRVKQLFDVHRKFDKVHPESKHNQRLKRHIMGLSSHDKNATVKTQMLTPIRQNTICSKKTLNMTILPPNSAEHVLSHLLMTPITSPDDHSPIESAPSVEINDTVN